MTNAMSQSSTANPLERYFRRNKGRRIVKWTHYFDIYHQFLAKYRRQDVVLLEFGVAHGGSLQMWKHYFGKKARVIGVDINPRCQSLTEDQIEVYIGDQGNKHFLRKLIKQVGKLDIVIDDGGHFMKQQITTFEEMFPAINKQGFFITEDIHTSYMRSFGGGYKRNGTFVEYVKKLIDQIQARHSQDLRLRVNDISRTLRGINVYDSIIVFEKDDVVSSQSEMTGVPLEGW